MNDRKLNMDRVKSVALWFTLISMIAALLFFSINRKSNAKVKTLVVKIQGINGQDELISEKEVVSILTLTAGKSLNASNIKTLNLRKLEARLNKDRRIERADIYFDSKDRLNVLITQKKPIMRIIDPDGVSSYIDDSGNAIPVQIGNAVRVPIVTGLDVKYDRALVVSELPSMTKEMFKLMKYVSEDEFLSALVEQAYLSSDSISDIVLVPKIGRERLILGNTTDMEAKFKNLKIFYRDGLPRLGWSRYKALNLKYANQVTGTLANPNQPRIVTPVLRDSLQIASAVLEKESDN